MRLNQVSQEELSESAIIFTPHPDDESLGCGGTIIKKINAGANVHMALLTDGRTSHAQFMDSQKLADIRQQELVNASKVLGIPEESVSLMGYPDGQLHDFVDEATEQVVMLIRKLQPKQIFIPYKGEMPSDHYYTWLAVQDAIKACDVSVTIYEYPIWFWYHWPRITNSGQIRKKILWKNTIKSMLGLSLITTFNSYLNIESQMAQKKNALDQHATQMSRYENNPKWPILNDVGKGRFMDCFYRPIEIFKKYKLG